MSPHHRWVRVNEGFTENGTMVNDEKKSNDAEGECTLRQARTPLMECEDCLLMTCVRARGVGYCRERMENNREGGAQQARGGCLNLIVNFPFQSRWR